MDKTKTDVVTSTSTFTFNYKSSWEHICSVFARPLQIIGTFVGIFGAFWMLYEASVSSLELSPNRFFPYLAFLGISVVAALGVRVYQYVNEIPDGLESVNRTAQRIAQLRCPLWEFRFAKSVLAERLSPIDDECSDLLKGNVFVHASQPNDIHEYFTLMSERQNNLSRLAGIVNRVIVNEFPVALRSTEDIHASPKNIVTKIESIARLYRETVVMERMSHSVIPPTHFEKLHSLQIGWSQPIRDAIQELFQLLQKICDVDYRKNSNLDFTIEFDVPSTLQEFSDELARLEKQLPQILAE